MIETNYFPAILQGAGIGFGLAFLIGPVFFALLQASIDYGFWVSVAIAFGVVCSDILLMGLSYFLLKELQAIPNFNFYMALAGGILLVGFGFHALFSKTSDIKKETWKMKDVGILFSKGFIINSINPFSWMFWMSTTAMGVQEFGLINGRLAFVFYAAAALTVFSTDAAKAFGARYLTRILSDRNLILFKRISGICLAAFGCKLLYMAFKM